MKDGRLGTLEELMEGKVFSCKGIYPKEVIKVFWVNQNQAERSEEDVYIEDIGSDWEEEDLPRDSRKQELKTRHALGHKIPKIEQLREGKEKKEQK